MMTTTASSVKVYSAVLATLVHCALLALLFFGVDWRSESSDAVEVELWDNLPRQAEADQPPAPEPAPALREPPQPQPRAKIEPKPKPEPKRSAPEPELKKPDIATEREKLDRLRRDREDAEREETERVLREDRERKLALAEQLRRENDSLRRQQAEEVERQRQAAAAATAAQQKAVAEYINRIRSKVRGNVVLPQGLDGNPEAIFDVTQLPSGDIVVAKLRRSSGHPQYDEAVHRAILKSSPLPKAPDPDLFQRQLELRFRPQDAT